MFISQRLQSQIEFKKKGKGELHNPSKTPPNNFESHVVVKSVTAMVAEETHPQSLQTAPRSLTLLPATATTFSFRPVFVCVSNKPFCCLCVFCCLDRLVTAFERTALEICNMQFSTTTLTPNRPKELTVNLKAVALDLLSRLLRCPSIPTSAHGTKAASQKQNRELRINGSSSYIR